MFTGLAAITGAAALAVAPIAFDLDQEQPPSVIQLCAATSISEVDALLAGVADTGLVGSLQPLLSLTVPDDADALNVRGDVTLDDVRTALQCEADPEPTTSAPAPTETADPTSETPSTSTGDAPPTFDDGDGSGDDDGSGSSGGAGDGFSQLDDVPSLPAQTGGGPAE